MAHENDVSADQIKVRLMRFRRIDPTTGCWEWTGKKDRGGYGQLTVRILGRTYPVNLYAHRLAVALLQGKQLRADCHVDHICRNPACFNPDHVRQVRADTNLTRRRYAKQGRCQRCGQVHGVSIQCKKQIAVS